MTFDIKLAKAFTVSLARIYESHRIGSIHIDEYNTQRYVATPVHDDLTQMGTCDLRSCISDPATPRRCLGSSSSDYWHCVGQDGDEIGSMGNGKLVIEVSRDACCINFVYFRVSVNSRDLNAILYNWSTQENLKGSRLSRSQERQPTGILQ